MQSRFLNIYEARTEDRMRGGKVENNNAGPLFPRLHVNDAEKAGPKAPPRNKMALYEQLSMSSQRFTNAQASLLPLPSVYGGTFTNIESSSQVCTTSHKSNGEQGSQSINGLLNKTYGNSTTRLMTTNYIGDVNIKKDFYLETMCTTFQPYHISQLKRPSLTKNVDPELGTQHLLYKEEETHPQPLQANVVKSNTEEVPVSSSFQTMSSGFISPDVVVEMIGHTHFWKARRAIIDQQRVFSMQVFELHRILKLQRVLVGSKKLLTEEIMFTKKAFSKASSMHESSRTCRNPSTDIPSLVESKQDVQEMSIDVGNPIVKQPHTLNENPLLNQWLVPVLSPSEGLIYKPYTAESLYPSLETQGADREYNFPVSPALSLKYFPPFGLSIMSPSISTSTGDHSSIGRRSNGYNALYQSSSIVTSERKTGRYFDNEKHECRANMPKKRPSIDALPLFPISPTDCGSVQPPSPHRNENKTHVIKVVPRNPSLASESAARIIQLIQEERKHLCN